ncbi:MAG: hypothetical protein IJ428_05830 [Clostridia bacterium]|nr:hypothetical protein [Clostridia bacterium]
MTAWADYSYYLENYLMGKSPTVASEDFPFYAARATASVKHYTFDNIIDGANVPDEAKRAVCAVAEVLSGFDKALSGIGVTSEKTGDLSVTYASGSERERELNAAIRRIVYMYLASGGYLYSGVMSC